MSVSIPALKAEASSSSWAWLQPTPGRCAASLSLQGLCTMGREPVALVMRGNYTCRPQGGGSGFWGSPSLCSTLAPMRPALIGHPFLLSFNVFIPASQMGRKVP